MEAPRNLSAVEDSPIPKQLAVAVPTLVARRDEDPVEAEGAVLAALPNSHCFTVHFGGFSSEARWLQKFVQHVFSGARSAEVV